ncbi:MAG: hypothetical protein IJ838_03435 [Paludibacteraceae bacterium]|nr:hypothetical protein [Paludibacteraceae bacterium]
MKKNYSIPMTETMPLGVASALCVSGGAGGGGGSTSASSFNINPGGIEEQARSPRFE